MENTIAHCLLESLQRPIKHTAFIFKSGHSWLKWNWQDLHREVESLAGFLLQKGLQAGDRIAIYADTRIEWLISDLAIMSIGAITIPIYSSHREEDIEFIINDSTARYLICDTNELYERWQNVAEHCPSVKGVMVLAEGPTHSTSWTSWREAIVGGRRYSQDHSSFLEESIHRLKMDQTATILYTSGTTGQPKGVVLTHRQVMSEVREVFDLFAVDHRDTSLTFLPYAHILGRVEAWGSIYAGYTLAFAENLDKLRQNLQEIRPTLLIGVPRVFEKIYNSIRTQVEAHPLKHRLFQWAVRAGTRVSELRLKKSPLPITDLTQYLAAKQLVFEPLKQKLGGRLRFAMCGGAPLSREIAEFFHAADILLLEGYGLTETTAAITANTPYEYKFGTVGRPFGDVQIRIADDGEILVKSDKVMSGYFNNSAATANVMTKDKFFMTGDIGEFDSEGFLKITDRKKDLIKTAGGKYVAPQRLENMLKLSKYISQVLIHGDRRKYIVALITLDPQAIEEFSREENISYSDYPQLTQHPKVKELIRDAVAEANAHLATFETIKNFAILPKEFTIENGELTPSLKVKRRFCDQKYKDNLDRIYGVDSSEL